MGRTILWFLLLRVLSVLSTGSDVVGYDASLKLFKNKGKACARLNIQKRFADRFRYSWVGFYKHMDDGHSSYIDWQWFNKMRLAHTGESLTYEYESKLDIQDGVQVRFFLEKAKTSVLAQTEPWGEEAIREIQNNVRGYDASLLLFANGGKACARLYIKKSFINWKAEFANAWVGFYNSGSDQNRKLHTWDWVTSFRENEDQYTEEYMAYDYNSGMTFSHRVEARFFLSKDYSQRRSRITFTRLTSLAVKHSADLSILASLLPCILASF